MSVYDLMNKYKDIPTNPSDYLYASYPNDISKMNDKDVRTIYNDMDRIIGKGYNEFRTFKGRYRVVKGSRGSKKSMTASLDYIEKIMAVPGSNLLVIRRYMNTHKESTRATLIKAIYMLGVQDLWTIPKAEHTLTYNNPDGTKQKIFFRGLDDPQSITSMQVEEGHLCWVWFEEAFQIMKEADFDKIDLSIRGKMPPHIWKQLTLTFNPWSEKHWIKARFYDKPHYDRGDIFPSDINAYKYDTLAMTTTFRDNEFLDKADLDVFAKMETSNPRRFDIEGNGNWGIAEGLIFDNWQQMEFDYKRIIKNSLNIHGKTHLKIRFGLDFGYTNDVAALIACIVDEKNMIIYIFDEYYQVGMTNKMLAEMLRYKGYDKDVIRCDSAEPKSIDELKYYGIYRAKAAVKGKDSVKQGIGRLRDYKIIVHEKCENTIIELLNYVWDKDPKTDKILNDPVDDYNHLMDALRYATVGIKTTTFRF